MPVSPLFASRLQVLQSFKEVTWGTSLAATAKWMGVVPRPTFKPYTKAEIFEEQRGSFAQGYNAAILKKGGEWSINQHATFEDILFALYAGVNGAPTVTPSAPNYLYEFPFPLTSAWTAQSYTFEYSYSTAALTAAGALCQKLGIKGEASKQWELSMSGFYKTHNQNATLTPALTDRTVQMILTPITELYMDVAGGTVGTTAFANTLLSFSIDIDTGIKPIFTASALEPSSWVTDKYVVDLSIDMLYTAAVKSFLTTNWLAGLPALIRLKNTSGAKIAQFDFSGVLADDPTFYGDKDGAQMVSFKLSSIYDSALANYAKFAVTNTVAALP